MKSLRQHIDEAGERYDEQVIMPEFFAWFGDEVVQVQAILDRTAVIIHNERVEDKSVVNLNKILIDEVMWVDRAPQDTLNRKARRRGHMFSGISRLGRVINGNGILVQE